MRNLDSFDKVKKRISEMNVETILYENEIVEWNKLDKSVIEQKLMRICSKQLCDEDVTVVYTLYSRLKWIDAFKSCLTPNNNKILELGSGSSDLIPRAISIFDPTSEYITANMNKELTEQLKRKTESLPISINIVEDDAINIKNYYETNTVDLIILEHSVNDILQAILCERSGIDTTKNDWFDVLPEMIKLISDDFTNNLLESKTKAIFLSLLENCLSVLKQNGYFIMSHYMFQYDLDLGYNVELWENMLPIIREWLKELSVGKEVFFDGMDSQWWLFYQK